MNLILLGAPGAGKGTIAVKLSKKFNIPHIATGDMLRENVANKTKLGLEAQSYMDKGLLVPDNVVIDMIKERLGNKDCKNGFILDGFPRTINQANALKQITKINKVINLQTSDEVFIKRLSGRRICSKCNAIFHVDFIKPERENVCDKCNGKLYQREDDKPEAVKERLKVYRKETEPLIDYYKNRGLLVNIDASGRPEEVFGLVVKALNK